MKATLAGLGLGAVALATVLACSGCSVSVPIGRGTDPPGAASTPIRIHTKPGTPSLPRLLAARSSPAAHAKLPAGASSEERAFVSDVNGFCRTWYSEQRAADLSSPLVSQHHAYAVRELVRDRTLTQQLATLTAPSAMAPVFTQFVANEQRMVAARVKLASPDPATVDEGSDEYDTAVFIRHGYARQLGASLCDGVLPPAQEVAAERAAQRFDLTTDVHEGCSSLVTPDFMRREWGQSERPMATCRHLFRVHRLGSLPVPGNIRVSSVTGVDDLSATVSFHEVPDCGCGPLTARLYLLDGRWLVSNMTYGT